ncbi:hypothetical protein GGP41_004571 [Bipolaris sorokiniana]|uniref:Uncharacterized protein n=1 Tax=Cochliobolus sativus TaxID=45130 RepID=A0A8H5ZC06_COCSA|nr:hypothetical protein GGP41_004571 [Bipolaris sorokiniana]
MRRGSLGTVYKGSENRKTLLRRGRTCRPTNDGRRKKPTQEGSADGEVSWLSHTPLPILASTGW